MGWEIRGNHRYYTRSKKQHGRVIREYVGGGIIGEMAARLDLEIREERLKQKQELNTVLEQTQVIDSAILSLCQYTDQIVNITMLLAGYRQHHRGEWRLKRNEKGTKKLTPRAIAH